MTRVFGIDFGTTNSLASIIVEGIAHDCLDSHERPHASVVWYDGNEVLVGNSAGDRLAGETSGAEEGVVRAPKRLLASHNDLVSVAGVDKAVEDPAAEVFRHLVKDAAEQRFHDVGGRIDSGSSFPSLTEAVVTIPVTFPGFARKRLRTAAGRSGVKIRQMVHEPFAALYGWLRQQDDMRARIAELEHSHILVVDWGGGTLDVTLARVRDGGVFQVTNGGDDALGGDFVDESFQRSIVDLFAKREGASATQLMSQINPAKAASLRSAVERTKIALSSSERELVSVKDAFTVEETRDLLFYVERTQLEEVARPYVNLGMAHIDEVLAQAGLDPSLVRMCLVVGGMANMPLIQRELDRRFGSRLVTPPNPERLIAQGAAWIAADDARMKLSKPLEVLHADESYVALLEAGTALPLADHALPTQKFIFYCVDPRDGVAKFQFARPKRDGLHHGTAPRMSHKDILSVDVDPESTPLVERIELSLTIDQNLVLHVDAHSTGLLDEARLEIHDLEFGVELPRRSTDTGWNESRLTDT